MDNNAETNINQMHNTIIYDYPFLSEPKIPYMIPTMIDYPLAPMVECMRLILFIFIVTISISISQLATSAVGLLADIVSNFDEHFVRLVPVLLT